MEPEEIKADDLIDKELVQATHLETLADQMVLHFTLLSKTKFSFKLSDEDILKAFKHRFGHSLPLNNIDCVLVESLEIKASPVALSPALEASQEVTNAIDNIPSKMSSIQK